MLPSSHFRRRNTLGDNLTRPASGNQFQNSPQGPWRQAPEASSVPLTRRIPKESPSDSNTKETTKKSTSCPSSWMIHLGQLERQASLFNGKRLLWITLNFPSTFVAILLMKTPISYETSPLTNDETSSQSVSDNKKPPHSRCGPFNHALGPPEKKLLDERSNYVLKTHKD